MMSLSVTDRMSRPSRREGCASKFQTSQKESRTQALCQPSSSIFSLTSWSGAVPLEARSNAHDKEVRKGTGARQT